MPIVDTGADNFLKAPNFGKLPTKFSCTFESNGIFSLVDGG
jgi:hypothetical protein